jgi:hypothetical protein
LPYVIGKHLFTDPRQLSYLLTIYLCQGVFSFQLHPAPKDQSLCHRKRVYQDTYTIRRGHHFFFCRRRQLAWAGSIFIYSTCSQRKERLTERQCCGSGSECFWASRIRIRLRILLSSSKNSKKNLDSYYFVTSLCLFIFEK